MSRSIRPATPRELDAWRNLADLRINHHNVHAAVTVGDYNQRFGTNLATWEAVADDVATRTVLVVSTR